MYQITCTGPIYRSTLDRPNNRLRFFSSSAYDRNKRGIIFSSFSHIPLDRIFRCACTSNLAEYLFQEPEVKQVVT